MRLDMGEFYADDSDGRKNVTNTARTLFINIIQKVEPQVWEDLYDNCFDIYSKIYDQDYYLTWEKLKSASKQNNCPEVELYEKIVNWSLKYNLNHDWLLEAVMLILYDWFKNDGKHKKVEFVLPFTKTLNLDQALDPSEQHFNFSFYWDPFMKTKQEFITGAKQKFDEVINDETKRIIELMEGKGYKRVPEKRIDRTDHFERVARFIILKWSYEEIGQHETNKASPEKEPITPEAVKKGIASVVSLMSIDINPRN